MEKFIVIRGFRWQTGQRNRLYKKEGRMKKFIVGLLAMMSFSSAAYTDIVIIADRDVPDSTEKINRTGRGGR
ncbi:MAG: hypothetical protein DRI57_21215 [Deltaproteobacteria bacterium]|nr:MAG: hypothetical protein DRI57_21215 [Deltaproteobacteria bacterium]